MQAHTDVLYSSRCKSLLGVNIGVPVVETSETDNSTYVVVKHW